MGFLSKKKKKTEEKSLATVSDYALLRSPLITEKSSNSAGTGRTSYAFEVNRRASKTEIEAAIERVFSVKVESVRTCNVMGKPKRTTRSEGRRISVKKAYVTLKEGYTISVVEGV